MSERKIWLVGLHMTTSETMIMFGGQAISDNNLKYAHIMKFNITNNKMVIKDQ
jgi:hypothetical protein